MGMNKEHIYKCYILTFRELLQSEDPLAVLEQQLTELGDRQVELGLSCTHLYDWTAMVMDNASEERGDISGLEVHFNSKRQEKYKEYLL